jgi:predicted patatin/cPLA2 family phospholipase
MDNLVGILKSMEAATGTNVVSTQVTSAVEVAGNFATQHQFFCLLAYVEVVNSDTGY